MNKTNSILKVLAVAGLLTFSQVIQAQTQQPNSNHGQKNGQSKEQRKEQAEQRFNEFSQRLNLTDDQKTKIKGIMKASREEGKTIRENNPAKEDRKPKMMALMQKTDEQINGVLDSKQQELYKQYKAERKEKRKAEKQKGKSQKEDDDHDENEMM